MDIQPTRFSPIGLDPKAKETAQYTPAADASAQETSQPREAAPPSPNADRVEISDAARARTEESKEPILERARDVLRDWPGLDPERLEMIRARLEEGAYSKPESVKQMAEGFLADLTGQTPDGASDAS